MLALIGSRALMFRAPHLLQREPKDFDFIASSEDDVERFISDNQIEIKNREQLSENKFVLFGEVPFEFEIATPNSSSHLFLSFMAEDKRTLKTKFGAIPNIELLMLLKESHRFSKSPHFWKTAQDWLMLKSIGVSIKNEYKDLLKLREKETYIKKTPRLQGMTTENFFNGDQVPYKYFHDDIHEAIKRKEKPAYRYYQKPSSEVECSKEMFFQECDQETRLFGVVEEAEVLALERSQIPYDFKPDQKWSFKFAVERMCCGIIGGWFREFAYSNLPYVFKIHNENYVEKFQEAIKLNKVRPYDTKLDINPYK